MMYDQEISIAFSLPIVLYNTIFCDNKYELADFDLVTDEKIKKNYNEYNKKLEKFRADMKRYMITKEKEDAKKFVKMYHVNYGWLPGFDNSPSEYLRRITENKRTSIQKSWMEFRRKMKYVRYYTYDPKKPVYPEKSNLFTRRSNKCDLAIPEKTFKKLESIIENTNIYTYSKNKISSHIKSNMFEKTIKIDIDGLILTLYEFNLSENIYYISLPEKQSWEYRCVKSVFNHRMIFDERKKKRENVRNLNPVTEVAKEMLDNMITTGKDILGVQYDVRLNNDHEETRKKVARKKMKELTKAITNLLRNTESTVLTNFKRYICEEDVSYLRKGYTMLNIEEVLINDALFVTNERNNDDDSVDIVMYIQKGKEGKRGEARKVINEQDAIAETLDNYDRIVVKIFNDSNGKLPDSVTAELMEKLSIVELYSITQILLLLNPFINICYSDSQNEASDDYVLPESPKAPNVEPDEDNEFKPVFERLSIPKMYVNLMSELGQKLAARMKSFLQINLINKKNKGSTELLNTLNDIVDKLTSIYTTSSTTSSDEMKDIIRKMVYLVFSITKRCAANNYESILVTLSEYYDRGTINKIKDYIRNDQNTDVDKVLTMILFLIVNTSDPKEIIHTALDHNNAFDEFVNANHDLILKSEFLYISYAVNDEFKLNNGIDLRNVDEELNARYNNDVIKNISDNFGNDGKINGEYVPRVLTFNESVTTNSQQQKEKEQFAMLNEYNLVRNIPVGNGLCQKSSPFVIGRFIFDIEDIPRDANHSWEDSRNYMIQLISVLSFYNYPFSDNDSISNRCLFAEKLSKGFVLTNNTASLHGLSYHCYLPAICQYSVFKEFLSLRFINHLRGDPAIEEDEEINKKFNYTGGLLPDENVFKFLDPLIYMDNLINMRLMYYGKGSMIFDKRIVSKYAVNRQTYVSAADLHYVACEDQTKKILSKLHDFVYCDTERGKIGLGNSMTDELYNDLVGNTAGRQNRMKTFDEVINLFGEIVLLHLRDETSDNIQNIINQIKSLIQREVSSKRLYDKANLVKKSTTRLLYNLIYNYVSDACKTDYVDEPRLLVSYAGNNYHSFYKVGNDLTNMMKSNGDFYDKVRRAVGQTLINNRNDVDRVQLPVWCGSISPNDQSSIILDDNNINKSKTYFNDEEIVEPLKSALIDGIVDKTISDSELLKSLEKHVEKVLPIIERNVDAAFDRQ
ncbi:hypothetical protein TVAG_050680 [Trichomonas vaginalis G3]|uniref:Uncharacterized protein n=1 Tax=Trichomonas vaginalis (strain ATCC PRA-98 / G3) TaxID=412133 RepID=A2G369_TRIV3|nr:hypothetical protein TVAGG3_1058450 [Trichomonas vaginalis G3]EAX88406.1 hypothetical protein TVAG_050680 [Trichomonas vaginalis G3]KAI5494577.1 hypothetical protein TVAGG3_1058450 [Trichomonas vaginalis G3]|eukprot:XP_001301336.1 hypothetical protein [Trichomonas vaginalis G3]